jgi:hypothetical protein
LSALTHFGRTSTTAIIILCLFSSVFAYSGGNGEPNNPYQIGTVGDWQQLMSTSSHWNKCFIMTADVNLYSITLTPVGNSTTKFTGTLNGDGHIISNATINQPTGYYIGLFGYLDGGQISNLGAKNINVTGNNYVGGLVGLKSGTISNCYTTGTVTVPTSTYSDCYLGGLVGWNKIGTISNCYTNCTVSRTNSSTHDISVGGAVGYNEGIISSCYAIGTVACSGTVNSYVSYYIGGLVGENHGVISHSYTTGAVTETVSLNNQLYESCVGGLVGYSSSGTISSCYATGNVTGRYVIGSLVGAVASSNISDCYATGSATNTDQTNGSAGGLAGYIGDSNIYSCYATGDAVGNRGVGGLVGVSYSSKISTCYAIGSVKGDYQTGGLVGYNRYDSIISNCYATGLVSGKSYPNSGTYAGGIAGMNGGVITSCYATGAIQCSSYAGGLIGWNDGTISYCYSASVPPKGLIGNNNIGIVIASFGCASSSGGKVLTITKMKTMSVFQNAGWAGKGWVINDGIDYPHLEWEGTAGVPIPAAEPVPLAGSGTEADPYQIWTAADFALLSYHTSILDKNIMLMTDVNLASTSLCPIGDLDVFTGIFDGNGKTIRNLVIKGGDYVGLFSYISSGVQINNLYIEDANVTGKSFVSVIAGKNSGEISSCHAEGVVYVKGTGNYIGGLVGQNSKVV